MNKSNNITTKQQSYHNHSFLQASGPVNIKLTTDIAFHLLLERNQNVLLHLISSLLHIKPEKITSVKVLNPIKLGDYIGDKGFELDVLVNLNDDSYINLEMQVANQFNWPDRTLSYTSRLLDHLKKGESYKKLHPVIHIGFLDYTLFTKYPEFYAKYQLLNVKNLNLFSGKLTINVLDLNQIELATQEDKTWELDYWASLFKSTTWEELKMLAEQNEVFADAAQTVYDFCRDESIRKVCEDREDYIRNINGLKDMIAEAEAEKEAALAEKEAALSEKKAAHAILLEKEAYIAKLEAMLAEKK